VWSWCFWWQRRGVAWGGFGRRFVLWAAGLSGTNSLLCFFGFWAWAWVWAWAWALREADELVRVVSRVCSNLLVLYGHN